MLVTAIHILFQIILDIMMRDEQGKSFNEIDKFQITIPIPSGNQEEVFTGERGIANITLSYDIICIEPNACTTTVTSSELIGTCKVRSFHFELLSFCTLLCTYCSVKDKLCFWTTN